LKSNIDNAAFDRLLLNLPHIPKIYVAEEIDSTQRWANEAFQSGAKDGSVFIADHQTKGRGRSGRSWWSSPGTGLLMSWLVQTRLRPEQMTTLTFHFGLAIARALEPWAGSALRLKWPNDLLLNDKKLGGILAEATPTNTAGGVAILGVGINLGQKRQDFPDELQDIGTSLSQNLKDTPPPRDEVIASVITELNAIRPDLEAGVVPVDAWLARAAWRGEDVVIQQEGQARHGVFHGIQNDGTLVLKGPNAETILISHGDLLRKAK